MVGGYWIFQWWGDTESFNGGGILEFFNGKGILELFNGGRIQKVFNGGGSIASNGGGYEIKLHCCGIEWCRMCICNLYNKIECDWHCILFKSRSTRGDTVIMSTDSKLGLYSVGHDFTACCVLILSFILELFAAVVFWQCRVDNNAFERVWC